MNNITHKLASVLRQCLVMNDCGGNTKSDFDLRDLPPIPKDKQAHYDQLYPSGEGLDNIFVAGRKQVIAHAIDSGYFDGWEKDDPPAKSPTRFDWHNAQNAQPPKCVVFTTDAEGQQDRQIAECDSEEWAIRIAAALNQHHAAFDSDELHDIVITHGHGAPTEDGYELGAKLVAQDGDYAKAAAEVAFRGLTTEAPQYNDKLDPNRQITAEEKIAAMICEDQEEHGDLNEWDVSNLGRNILLQVLAEFRPDLIASGSDSSEPVSRDTREELLRRATPAAIRELLERCNLMPGASLPAAEFAERLKAAFGSSEHSVDHVELSVHATVRSVFCMGVFEADDPKATLRGVAEMARNHLSQAMEEDLDTIEIVDVHIS